MTTVLEKRATTAIKSIGGNEFEGYLVVWGDSTTKDLQGEYFTPDTDFALDWYDKRPAIFHHGLDGKFKAAPVGVLHTLTSDNIGLKARGRYLSDDDMEAWKEEIRQQRKVYINAVRDLVDEGIMNFSSGSLAHLVETADDGQIKRWPLVEGSLTPTPAEPRLTNIQAVKSAFEVLGLDPTKLGIPAQDDTGDKEANQEPKGRKSDSADTKQLTTKLDTNEDSLMNEEQLAQIRELVLGLIAEHMPEGKMGMTDDEESKMSGEVAEEVAEKMGDAYDDEDGAKSVNVNRIAELVAAAIPAQVEAVMSARAQRAKSMANAFEAAQKAALRNAPAKSQTGGVDQRPASQRVEVKTPYERAGWTAEDYSFAAQLADGGVKTAQNIVKDEKFWRAAADVTLKSHNSGAIKLRKEAVKRFAAIKDDEVMYSTLSGFGDEHVPTVWSDNVWEKPRTDVIVPNAMRTVEMPSNPYEYPVESTDPIVKFVPEVNDQAQLSLDASGLAPQLAQIGTTKVTFSAKKLGFTIPISAELEEDGIAGLIPHYRNQSEKALLEAQDFVVFNGDVATTGNVNSDGETISAIDRKYQAYNGLIKQTFTASNNVDAGGASPTVAHIRKLRQQLGAAFRGYADNLILIADSAAYVALLNADAVNTLDKYGAQATVLTGELGRVDGIRLFQTDQMALADTDGKVTQTSNTTDTGRILLVHVPSWFVGYRRQVTSYMQFLPQYETHLLTMTLRNSLVGRTYSDNAQQASDDTVAMLYNIAV